MDRAAVIEMLKGAFPLLPLPAMSIHQAHLADDTLSRKIPDEEWAAAGALDAGRTWMDFSDADLVQCREGLAHFDEDSFVYYLPAFLSFAVRHSGEEGSQDMRFLVGSALFAVTDLSAYSRGRYNKLTSTQRDAVVCFLDYMTEHAVYPLPEHAEEALRVYWRTPEAGKPLILVP
jgi:hypothetical protein